MEKESADEGIEVRGERGIEEEDKYVRGALKLRREGVLREKVREALKRKDVMGTREKVKSQEVIKGKWRGEIVNGKGIEEGSVEVGRTMHKSVKCREWHADSEGDIDGERVEEDRAANMCKLLHSSVAEL